MPSTAEFLNHILDTLSVLDHITYRSMMGEYILYYRGKIFGGIYDNQLLIKNIPAAKDFFAEPILIEPYPHAKPMLLVEDIDNAELLCRLISAMDNQLPPAKK